MQKLNYSIAITAPKEKVWETLWDTHTYPQWAYAIDPGHYLEDDYHTFKVGQKVRFLHPSGAGTASVIDAYGPNKLITYRTVADIKNGVEQTIDESVAWAGATETITLTEKNGVTTVAVTFDVPDGHKEEFTDTYPRALQKLKELAEA